MSLIYNDFNVRNLKEEIEEIDASDLVNIRISMKDKGLLFLLGMLFAAGKKINIINKEELDFSKNINFSDLKKSFYMMSYVWECLGDDNFSKQEISNLSELDKLIENIRRIGVRVNPIIEEEHKDKIFLISPVRDANKEQIKEIDLYKEKMLNNGFKMHIPSDDTVQSDLLGGYAICYQNATAIASSSEIHLYYDQKSKGSMFDLGVAYYLNKKLVLINEEQIVFNDSDFGDNIVKNWNNSSKELVKR